MVLTAPQSNPTRRAARRYLRQPVPLHFPVSEEVPETARHFKARALLADSIEQALGSEGFVCSDQFLYWDPTNPKRSLAPDVAVRVGGPRFLLDSWKTWEHGAPHVGIEIISDSDASDLAFEQKLERYQQAGVAEVVRFEWEDRERPIRVWDWVAGDMVERDLADPDALLSDALRLYWCQRVHPELGPTLRLARDRAGAELAFTSTEAALAQKDAALAEKDAAFAQKDAALAQKDAALARIAELEAELRRR